LSEIELANQILGEAGFAVDAVQGHYSLLYRGHEHAENLNYCAAMATAIRPLSVKL
jgi:aryl-alcohol dehydrogenase-like predicted oxidoreductase